MKLKNGDKFYMIEYYSFPFGCEIHEEVFDSNIHTPFEEWDLSDQITTFWTEEDAEETAKAILNLIKSRREADGI